MILFLSRNRFAERAVKRSEVLKKAAFRFVSGESLSDAIEATRKVNLLGIMATIDHLGESVHSEELARKATDVYIETLQQISETGVNSNISVKLSQLGLDIDFDLCLENLEKIIQKAAQLDNFVRIDMEDSRYTQLTLDIFRIAKERYPNVGIVLQALLRRTRRDVEWVVERGYSVRLCKGAYSEPKEIAFNKKAEIDNNFIRLLEMLLSKKARENGVYVGIATHDRRIIEWTKDFVSKNGIGRDEFEFQMLYGIRKDLQCQLASEGYRMRAYIPFGTHWYPYYMRRLAERPRNIFILSRAILSD